VFVELEARLHLPSISNYVSPEAAVNVVVKKIYLPADY
jgi:hypothetical protein